MRTSFAIALGSNMRHPHHGAPAQLLRAALAALDAGPVQVLRASPILTSRPIGPSQRLYANGAALIETDLGPEALLDHLKQLERHFGRKTGGQPWRARPLDLDILLWSDGAFVSSRLCIPHKELAKRAFVLAPLAQIAPQWRHPILNLCIAHLKARLDRKAPGA
ncbi:MAG: 2-amino-4-hydroxy-6-hydroxymethyldihydropteridine diphosphokinase [Sphingomonadaceae bacterium]|jgi:2-amino-4-hydroxy-6-hydroxymethyldihydropteridine diphosphokinase|nr:2-amino-4-hydroxy-6-hydroxymethyldihydropteridine diphosphokinase [Sphingomonadaceae bacterium]NBU78689.1 2-amino-4-hydroxy-6-hydroxymethyldihydropteridine diphosphokinase [Sphingomonadaceae bacterium]NCA02623.1 2-amino-4-hydroxy-6-hydroxymethyldihydropteridine diphosphokinase [Sphingomonadaceae bacterium]